MITTDTITHGNTRHGQSRSAATGRATPTYCSWVSMLTRCNNLKASNYHLYGARGISVCDRWTTFENFFSDVGVRPAGMTLDRFPNPNGNYEPGNVRWASPKQQAESRRPTSEWNDRPGPKHKTHCKSGHSLAGDNLRINRDGYHICRECRRGYDRVHRGKETL